jgi:CheY-like chemotaxis protein
MEGAALAGKRVLLVDDEQEFVEVVRVLLESNGYEVTAGHSGKEGKELAAREKPDVVILDVMMETDTAGFETARWLREQSDTKEIPIIMLTAVNQKFPFGFGPDDIWLPVDVFVEKPVSPERLLAEVRKAAE